MSLNPKLFLFIQIFFEIIHYGKCTLWLTTADAHNFSVILAAGTQTICAMHNKPGCRFTVYFNVEYLQ